MPYNTCIFNDMMSRYTCSTCNCSYWSLTWWCQCLSLLYVCEGMSLLLPSTDMMMSVSGALYVCEERKNLFDDEHLVKTRQQTLDAGLERSGGPCNTFHSHYQTDLFYVNNQCYWFIFYWFYWLSFIYYFCNRCRYNLLIAQLLHYIT